MKEDSNEMNQHPPAPTQQMDEKKTNPQDKTQLWMKKQAKISAAFNNGWINRQPCIKKNLLMDEPQH